MKFALSLSATLLFSAAFNKNAPVQGSSLRENSDDSSKYMNTQVERKLGLFEAVQSSLRPHEQLAFDLITRTSDVNSLVATPDNAGAYQILRAATLSARVQRMMVYVDERNQNEEFIGAIGLEFTDGSSAFAGTLGPVFRVEVISFPQALSGTITVQRRPGTDASFRIASIVAEQMGINLATQESEYRKSASSRDYDVDGRFLTGLVVSSESGFKTLQFIVTKKIERSELVDIDYDLSEFGNPQDAVSLDAITLTNDSSETQNLDVSYKAVEESVVSFRSEITAGFSASYGVTTSFEAKTPVISAGVQTSTNFEVTASLSSGQTDQRRTSNTVTKTVSIRVPPQTSMLVQVTQFQEQVADIPFTAKQKLYFQDGSSAILATIQGTMEGIVVSNTLISNRETPFAPQEGPVAEGPALSVNPVANTNPVP